MPPSSKKSDNALLEDPLLQVLPELDDDCPGFVFRYFSPGPHGLRRETKPTKISLEAENKILTRVATVLADRPDILQRLCCLENGVEVRLHQGHGFRDEELEVYFFGRTTVHGDDAILEFAADEVLHGGKGDHSDVMDVIVHELMHLIDYLDDDDGILPNWNTKQRHAFETARMSEWVKLKTDQATPMVAYALTNDVEFLAVLAEVYWVKPKALKQANPTLFTLMDGFFHP